MKIYNLYERDIELEVCICSDKGAKVFKRNKK